jgi:hypothetical protein
MIPLTGRRNLVIYGLLLMGGSFIAFAIVSTDLSDWIWSETAWIWVFIIIIFCFDFRVRTKSFAMILTESCDAEQRKKAAGREVGGTNRDKRPATSGRTNLLGHQHAVSPRSIASDGWRCWCWEREWTSPCRPPTFMAAAQAHDCGSITNADQ